MTCVIIFNFSCGEIDLVIVFIGGFKRASIYKIN